MSQAAAISKPSRTDVFVGQVLPPDRLHDVVSSMPAHVKPERFQRNLVIAITQHPRLLECDPLQVFNEVSKAAALGLYLDPQLGEAYLITGFSNGRYVPQLRLGYRGLIKLARQSGEVSDVYAHDVCASDKFKMTLGTDKVIYHEPDYQSDRGDVGLYYAVVKFANGATDFEPMSIKEIHRIRDRSDGWKAFKAGKIKSTPWGTDEGEMSKKTVLRRLLKRMPQSPELADALRIEDADYSDAPDVPQRLSLASRLAPAIGKRDGFSLEHVEIETNSISNSSQEFPPETDKPASESLAPNRADAGNSIQESSEGPPAADDGARAGVDENRGVGLPAGWQAIYVQFLTEVSKTAKSLKHRRTDALNHLGAEPSDADKAEMLAMEDLVKRRNTGALSADEFKAQLREIMPAGVEV